MEPLPDSLALPGLTAFDLAGGPGPERLGDGVGLREAAGPFTFFAGRFAGRRGLGWPEPPAHRAGVTRTAGGLRVAGAVRLDARQELAAKLGAATAAATEPAGHTAGEERHRADLELAAAAVERWGADAGDHLAGDFSLCAWDPRRRLFLAFRDPFGVLPLFLRRVGDVLLLSTSHRLLRGLRPTLEEPDETTLADFLLFGESVEPAATGWRGLRAVPAGHLLRARLHSATPGAAATLEERRYHRFASACGPAAPLGLDEAAEGVGEALDRAVADRGTGAAARSGGAVGVLASGGLDGSLVAASLAHNPSAPPARTYTFTYRRLLGDDSGEWARRVAAGLGLPALTLAADHHLPWGDGGELTGAPASPVHEPYFAVTAELARRARGDGCAVLLTGEGGDDLAHAGADDVLSWLLREPLAAGRALVSAARAEGGVPRLGLRSALLRRLGLTRLHPAARPWRPRFPAWLDPATVERLRLQRRWKQIAERHGRPRRGRRAAALDGLLHPRAEAVHRWYDVPAAAAGVEFRHPFLDHRVVAALLALPPFPHCRGKEVLRRSARGRLSREVRRRPKTLLPGEPLLAHLRGGAWPPATEAALHPTVARFLLLPLFEGTLKTSTDLTVWADTRPFSLSWWLQGNPRP